MARGAEVRIVVRSENVTVQATAIAQEAAGLGELVQVLPSGGSRVIRGRVLDARTVEVNL
jgi:flagella basal body P-ring formation protein FlgA